MNIHNFFETVKNKWLLDLNQKQIYDAIKLNQNKNILLIYTSPNNKIQIAIYAMTYKGIYVGSICPIFDKNHSLNVLKEAEEYKGLSIVIVNLQPYKMASKQIDEGSFVLYRFNGSNLKIDSKNISKTLEEFIKREEQLDTIVESKVNQTKINNDFNNLVKNLKTREETIIIGYGSDSGNSEQMAETLSNKLSTNGFINIETKEANDIDLIELQDINYLILLLSTSGQGEPTANSKNFFKKMEESKEIFPNLSFTVFGFGDSHYWGAGSEDSKAFFCLPAKKNQQTIIRYEI